MLKLVGNDVEVDQAIIFSGIRSALKRDGIAGKKSSADSLKLKTDIAFKNTGILDERSKLTSKDLNEKYIANGYFPPYHVKYPIRNILLNYDRKFFRVHGDDNQVSKWVFRAKEIDGLTPLQIKDKLALEFMPKYISQVDVPKNTSIRVSAAGPQSQWNAKGGGLQYELLQRIPEASYKHQMPIYQPILEPAYNEPYPGWAKIMKRK